jgi:hypothetical protein
LRDGQSNCNKRIKSDRLDIACRASNFGFVLTCHEISDDRLIAFDMCKPALNGNNIIWSIFTLHWLYIRFFFDSIQIFMKSIYNKREELLRIMLSIARKHWIYWTDCRFYFIRSKYILWITPHTFDKLSICLC